MKAHEAGVLEKSDIFFSTPSQTAKEIYFYPVSIGHFFCVKGYHIFRKSFDSLLVAHILSGKFTYLKNGKPMTARSGDTVILNCFKEHEYYTETKCEFIWAHVNGANSLALFEEIVRFGGNTVKCKDAQNVKKLMFRIFDCVRQKKKATESSISLDIYKLFIELLNPQNPKVKGAGSYEESIRDIKKYILENLNESLTVSSLAERVNMSVSHFSRVFKQQTGFSPYDYVLLARLGRAKYLLEETTMTIASIAYEIGFNSESNFIYFFTANEGISPGKFRKLNFKN